MNFFAIQVMSGYEDAYLELFSKSRPDISIYNIKKKMKTRKAGKEVQQVTIVFPGYLFFQCEGDQPSPALIASLKHTKNFVRILPATDKIKALDERDTEIIRHLVSFGREIGPSLVTFDEQNRIVVLQGPLKGLEGKIVKVNRRKRRAKVMLDLNNSPILFDLSYEVMEAIKENAR